jgi:hypothetical protein
MSTDNIDPSKKDATISSTDDLTKTTNKADVELSEEELKRVSGGVPQKADGSLDAVMTFKYDIKAQKGG